MQTDAIWNRAKADLVVTTASGDQDRVLWEHTVRIAKHTDFILSLPEVKTQNPDDEAVLAAVLYHEAGWLVSVEEGDVAIEEILLRPTQMPQRENAIALMRKRLGRQCSAETLARATEAIRALNQREPASIEAQVLKEADNLEEFGLLSIWNGVRRHSIDGKGVQALLDTWRRRNEYRFWDARLRDSFQFKAVADVARQRLMKLDAFMQELERQHEGMDLCVDESASPAVP